MLPGGVVLSGGGAKLAKIKELAREQLKLPCSIGKPTGILGLDDDPALATVAGLVLSGVDVDEFDKEGILGSIKGLSRKLKKVFRVFIP